METYSIDRQFNRALRIIAPASGKRDRDGEALIVGEQAPRPSVDGMPSNSRAAAARFSLRPLGCALRVSGR